MLDPTQGFRLLAARRGRALDALDPEAAQLRVLRRLLARAAGTRFGRAHRFAAIGSRADYVRAVPLRTWQQFWDAWWQPAFPILDDVSWPGRIPFFAETSGTTSGIAKHIPVSRSMLRANRSTALDLVLSHLRRDRHSRFFAGPGLILGGSTALTRLAPGVASGDLSGIVAATMPAWTHGRALPSPATALTGDWERKLARVVDEATGADLRSISGTTSWLVVLLERLLAAGGGAATLGELFPNLEMVIHGGVGFGPYRSRVARLLGQGPTPVEVYPASEGFIGYQDGAEEQGLRVPLDNGIFFEFVRPDELDRPTPRRCWVGDVPPGVDMALVLTTNAGLFSYVIGDLVRVVSRTPFRLLVSGRTAHGLSAFGEHLSGGELDRAVETAAREAGLHVTDYAVGVLMPDDADPRGGHLFAIECAAPPPHDVTRPLARAIDATLAAGNADYAAHREGGTGMRPPEIRLLPPGRFAHWMRKRGRLGGQNKVPRVVTDPASLARLLAPDPDQDSTRIHEP